MIWFAEKGKNFIAWKILEGLKYYFGMLKYLLCIPWIILRSTFCVIEIFIFDWRSAFQHFEVEDKMRLIKRQRQLFAIKNLKLKVDMQLKKINFHNYNFKIKFKVLRCNNWCFRQMYLLQKFTYNPLLIFQAKVLKRTYKRKSFCHFYFQ